MTAVAALPPQKLRKSGMTVRGAFVSINTTDSPGPTLETPLRATALVESKLLSSIFQPVRSTADEPKFVTSHQSAVNVGVVPLWLIASVMRSVESWAKAGVAAVRQKATASRRQAMGERMRWALQVSRTLAAGQNGPGERRDPSCKTRAQNHQDCVSVVGGVSCDSVPRPETLCEFLVSVFWESRSRLVSQFW